jgi:hypothetical protein
MTRETWTKKDEEALAELKARRERFYEAARMPLLRYINSDMPTVDSVTACTETADWMIANAKKLRNLLEPFDRGDAEDEHA